MSVLLVTDDDDDDIQFPKHEHFYQQIKELEYKYLFNESSLPIVVNPKTNRRRRRSRPQQCLVKDLLTYMITLLFLINHFHWSIIFISMSSIKFISTYALTTTTTTRPGPNLSPSIINEDEQQCSPMNDLNIEELCSKTCRAQKIPFEKLDNIEHFSSNSYYLSFCSDRILINSINETDFLNNLSENECRQMFNQLIKFDNEAQKASSLFAKYLEAIDSASNENRYSIIVSDCLKAYRTWTCSVKIPFFYRNRQIPPCHTICDEVERVCPTFRPSDREPLFAGQPLFFCNGGIVANSDYGQQPHCFDTCHLTADSFEDHSGSSILNKTSSSTELIENHLTTLSCFEIEPLPPSQSEQSLVPLINDDSISNHTSNTSISASAISIISSVWSSISVNILTFILLFLLRIL